MYKFKIKLQYNGEKLFCTKTVLLNFKSNLLLAKLDIAGSMPASNALIFPHDIPVDRYPVSIFSITIWYYGIQ